MQNPTPRLLNTLGVATVALLVASVVSAFAVRPKSSSAVSTPPPETSVSSVPLPGFGSSPSTKAATPPHAATTTTSVAGPGAAQPAPTTTAAPLPTVAGPVGDPGQATPEAPGLYQYDYSVSGGETASGVLDEKVTTASTTAGVTRQTVVDTGPGIAASQNRIVDWDSKGYFEVQRAFTFQTQSADCMWSPPVLELPDPVGVGSSWKLASTCQFSVYGQAVTVRLTGSATVTGKQRVKVGAADVNVWLVQAGYTANASSPLIGTFQIVYTGVDKVAASLGLLTQDNSTQTVTAEGRTTNAVTQESLLSIHPS